MKLRKVWSWVGVGTFSLVSQSFGAVGQSSFADLACTATREYVSALQFLRSHKELNLPDPEARKIAEEVAAELAKAQG